MRFHDPHGAAHLMAGILIEHRVKEAFRQGSPRGCGQFMRDDRQMPRRRMCPQRLDETAIAGAETVETGKLRMRLQKGTASRSTRFGSSRPSMTGRIDTPGKSRFSTSSKPARRSPWSRALSEPAMTPTVPVPPMKRPVRLAAVRPAARLSMPA